MAAQPALKVSDPPTLADLDALAPDMKGEIIEGVFYAMTKPRAFHQAMSGRIYRHVSSYFEGNQGGPGGWWILPEPGIELPGTLEISPDVAGWKRERLPTLPKDAPLRLVPDWVCEVLSPSTLRHDLMIKKPYYARVGVPFLWIVDPDARVLLVHALENGRWLELGGFGDEIEAHMPPFEVAPVNVAEWWLGDPDAEP